MVLQSHLIEISSENNTTYLGTNFDSTVATRHLGARTCQRHVSGVKFDALNYIGALACQSTQRAACFRLPDVNLAVWVFNLP